MIKNIPRLIYFLLFFIVFSTPPLIPTAISKKNLDDQRLNQELLSLFMESENVKIVVKQDYNKLDDLNLPFNEIAQIIFRCSGLQVVPSDSKTFDLLVKINAKGKILSKDYFGGGVLYSGCSLKGLIKYKKKNKEFVEEFDSTYSPPQKLSSRDALFLRSPSEIPFKIAIYSSNENGFCVKLLKFNVEVFGFSCIESILNNRIDFSDEWQARDFKYISLKVLSLYGESATDTILIALKDDDWSIKTKAIKYLAKIANKRSIESLILLLKNSNQMVVQEARESLQKISGEKFLTVEVISRDKHGIPNRNRNENIPKWESWWENNKQNYPD